MRIRIDTITGFNEEQCLIVHLWMDSTIWRYFRYCNNPDAPSTAGLEEGKIVGEWLSVNELRNILTP